MLQNVQAVAPTCVESVPVIVCILGRSVNAAQVSLCLQEIQYPAAIVRPARMQMSPTAQGMELVPVENVSVQRY
jgi:hypothetical protein